jgi:hypothetical protein
MTAIRESCLCGGVRFEITGPLMRSSHCHCAMQSSLDAIQADSQTELPGVAVRDAALCDRPDCEESGVVPL